MSTSSLDKNANYNDLLIYIEAARLMFDVNTICDKLSKTTKSKYTNSILDNIEIFLSNSAKSIISGVGDYENKYDRIFKEVEKYTEVHTETISDEKAIELINNLEKADSTGLSSLLFSVNIVLDRSYSYVYADESLEFVSKKLYGDNRLVEIQSSLQKYYKIISNKELSSTQLNAIIGIAIATLVAATVIPLGLVGGVAAKATATTTALKAIGFGDMQIGVAMIALSSALLCGTLTGGSYLAMKSYNANKLKEEFRSYTPDQAAMQLAIQVLVIELFKQRLSTKEFKMKLDSILSDINSLKNDFDHLLFVERNDYLKDKLRVFHGFDKCLSEILNIN